MSISKEELTEAIAIAVAASQPPPAYAPVPAPQNWFSDNRMLGIIGAALIAIMVWVFQDTKEDVEANRTSIGALTRNVDRLVTVVDASNKKLDDRGEWMVSQNDEAERSRMADKEHEKALEDIERLLGEAK